MSIVPPPIETEGSPVSTAADNASEPLPATLQQNEWTYVLEGVIDYADTSISIGILSDGKSKRIMYTQNGEINIFDGTNLATIGSYTEGTPFKAAVAVDANGSDVAFNGTTKSATVIGFTPTTLNIANGDLFGFHLNMTIDSLKAFPTRLSASEIAEMTS